MPNNRMKSLLSSIKPAQVVKPIGIKTNGPVSLYGDTLGAQAKMAQVGLVNAQAGLASSQAANTLASIPSSADSAIGGLNPRLTSIIDPVLKKYGMTISSGYRPNSKLKTSQHVHGNAADLTWPTDDVNVRRQIIQDLQKSGITGLGVGNNILHADIGPKRHWHYDSKGNWISGMNPQYADLFR